MPTRRKFIRDCALVAAATTLVPAAFAQDTSSLPAFPDSPSYDQFLRQVNTPFRLSSGSKSFEVTLVQANALPAGAPGSLDAGNEKFSLLFCGPRAGLEQDTYSFEHERLGRLAIFIVPVGGVNMDGCHYRAVFNRPVNVADFDLQLARAPRRAQRNPVT